MNNILHLLFQVCLKLSWILVHPELSADPTDVGMLAPSHAYHSRWFLKMADYNRYPKNFETIPCEIRYQS